MSTPVDAARLLYSKGTSSLHCIHTYILFPFTSQSFIFYCCSSTIPYCPCTCRSLLQRVDDIKPGNRSQYSTFLLPQQSLFLFSCIFDSSPSDTLQHFTQTDTHSSAGRLLTLPTKQHDHHPQVNPQQLTSTCLLFAPSALSPRRCAPYSLQHPLLSLLLPLLLLLVRHLLPSGWRPLSARAQSGATTTTRSSATSRTTAPRATDPPTTP